MARLSWPEWPRLHFELVIAGPRRSANQHQPGPMLVDDVDYRNQRVIYTNSLIRTLACDTWALLRWWFTTKRRYIKCMHLYLYLPSSWVLWGLPASLSLCILFFISFLINLFSFFFRAAVSAFKPFCPAHIVLRNSVLSNKWLIDWLIN